MLRIGICDDMPEFLKQVEQAILQWPGKQDTLQVISFSDADLLIDTHTRQPFDILFLDVVMPLLNGMDAAREIRQKDKQVKIVFLTASPEFGVESYSVKASNYLLKPLDRTALYTCLDELAAQIASDSRCIHVKSAAAVHRILLQDIEYAESQNKQVVFHLTDGRTVTGSEPLYVYEDHLTPEEGFCKCHRSYIVNLYRIEVFTGKDITLQSGSNIPIARGSFKSFEAAYFTTLFHNAEGT